jgi:hypothetical protein
MNIVVPNKEKYLRLLIGVYALLLIGLIGYAFWHGTYHLAQEDESIYYNSARSFAETGSVRATNCNNEGVSRIAQCNWYGPMYNIFYGSIAKIFGVHNYNFLITNLILFLVVIVLIMRSSFITEIKLLLTASLLALYPAIGYIFTFFPETLELLFAVILTLQLKKIFDRPDNNQHISQYILLVMFFALFRVTTVFWVFGLLALSKSPTDFTKKLTIGLACFILIYIYIYFFNAPFFGGSMNYVMSHKLGFNSITYLLHKTIINTFAFFTRNPAYDLLQVPVLFIVIYSCIISKNRLILAACIISIIYYSVLLTLYEPYTYFLNKQTACLYPLLLVALYTGANKINLKYIAFILLILISPLAYLKAGGLVRAKKKMANEYALKESTIKQLDEIKNKLQATKPLTILTLYREFDTVLSYPIFITSLPVSTINKQPILYTEVSSDDTPNSGPFKYEDNFLFYHKIHIDYVLSRHPLSLDSTSLVYSCNLFYLYQNNKQAK